MAGIPSNARQIWDYLVGQGLSSNAAAGILGNIEQESGGDPQAGSLSGGYGEIQWTPGYAYFSGPVPLSAQLPAIMSYINANGSVADINAHAGSPGEAALYFSQKYERPNPAAANNANRQQSAELVYQAAQSGWPQGSTATPVDYTTNSATNSTPTGSAQLASWYNPYDWMKSLEEKSNPGNWFGFKSLLNPVTEVGKGMSGILSDMNTVVALIAALFKPALWLRVGSFFAGLVAFVLAIWAISGALKDSGAA